MASETRLRVAVVGAGIAGLSAAWLLSRRHDVVVHERANRIGGHANTVLAPVAEGGIPVDAGFIVFNPQTYPNFVELLKVLGVPTQASNMSFAVSLDEGRLEYAGKLSALFTQPSNLASPQFWGMLNDLARFYRRAPRDASRVEALTLGEYLAGGGYGAAFRDWHVLPMASAIWSAAPADILAYPAAAFIRFHENHGLFKIGGRPVWRTVSGGSVEYVSQLALSLAGRIRYGAGVARVLPTGAGAIVVDAKGGREAFDHVVLACHADDALAILDRPTAAEQALLGAFRHRRNRAVMHTDERLMPKRRRVWSSWNYIGGAAPSPAQVSVTYWMNRLQNLDGRKRVGPHLDRAAPGANFAQGGGVTGSCLYVGSVFHRRFWLKPHRFRYRLYWLFVDLDELDAIDRRLKLFSLNRPNLFALYERDHARGEKAPLRPQIEDLLAARDVDIQGGSVKLLTIPRTFGYAFNPLSVYYCARSDGALAAILYEVRNTFGEHHAYVMPAAGDRRRACAKTFFVSPFLPMDLRYEFHAVPPGDTLSLAIRVSGPSGTVLLAGMKGERRPLTDMALLTAGLAVPAAGAKTIAAIHWEAMRLWAKGTPFLGRSRSHAAPGPRAT